MSRTAPGLKIGILGGGQLARMLAQSAHQMGLEPRILCAQADEPAAQVAKAIQGSLGDEKTLEKFLSDVDVATFESEFLDAELLARIAERINTPIYPSPVIMGKLQDRLTQKSLLDQVKIPTAPWIAVSSREDCRKAVDTLEFPLVFKKRRFGYDGYGTFIVKNADQLEEFSNQQLPNADGFIAEKWIPFKRELACIFARSLSGEVSHFPLVESLQKDARCFWVKGPIKHAGFATWATKFKRLLAKIDYVGVMGVELFDTKQGLLVNELAPRVHNTGHYTMDAFTTSQFDLHLKALLDQSMRLPGSFSRGFAMVNLLGSHSDPPTWNHDPEVRLHWYGKKQNRPGRKMGHINTVDVSPDAALKKGLRALRKYSI